MPSDEPVYVTKSMSKDNDNETCPSIHVTVDLSKPSQFIGPSVESGQPINYPLDNVEELLAWTADDSKDHGQPFSVSTVPHLPKVSTKDQTKVLLCHDMKGGYLNDRFVQGTLGNGEGGYHLSYWNMIDTFVYFSHHFITIPPVGWVNAAHRNGVTVLGTFITESNPGFKRCRSIFSSEVVWKEIVDRLLQISSFYRFDGWLINIENEIELDKVIALVSFVQLLTERMHKLNENSQVIWYDSVTKDGKLQWQNELNDNNKCFYDVCDGILLNYAWNPDKLQHSKAVSRSASSVYVGVDVFGRGCFAGGGFNSAAALAVIKKFDLSCGVFAPGWIYEQFPLKDFQAINRRFWKLLQPFCVSRPLDGYHGIASRFCPGNGPLSKRSLENWYHLNCQDTMPTLPSDGFSVIAYECGRESKLVVKLDTERRRRMDHHRLAITGGEELEDIDPPSSCLLFNLYMFAKEGLVTLITPHQCPCQFIVKTNIGFCGVSDIFKQTRTSDARFDSTTYSVDESFLVQAIYIDPRQTTLQCDVDFIELTLGLPRVPTDDVTITPTSLRCVDVDWKAEDEVFILGCTLIFESIPEQRASTQICCIQEGVQKFVGISCTSGFRVNDLRVFNPKYQGPDCYIIFTASHLSRIGLEVGYARLKVTYAENM